MADEDDFRRIALGLLLLAVLATSGCAAADRSPPAVRAGRALFESAFNPDRNFAGDLRPSSEDQLMLTAVASSRDDHAPDFSLAIAYRCLTRANGNYECRYDARMLRMRSPESPLMNELARAATRAERDAALDRANLDWVEADILDCDRALLALDVVGMADWSPDVHYGRQRLEVIPHPAQIRVRMTGTYVTSHYQGWRLGAGVPTAVNRLLEVLAPCWRPSSSAPPWRR
jgi:hypothetical protein